VFVSVIAFIRRVFRGRRKATDDDMHEYKVILSQKLKSINFPTNVLLCSENNCTNKVHFQQLNKYVTDITESCISAAESVIPCTCRRQNSSRIAGWSEHVQPLRDKSSFWHNLWLDCDRHKTGAVADCMRCTRAAYHYSIRKVKRDEDMIINERLAESLLTNDARDSWSSIFGQVRLVLVVSSMDILKPLVKLFADKYRDLYTSVPYDVNEMQHNKMKSIVC